MKESDIKVGQIWEYKEENNIYHLRVYDAQPSNWKGRFIKLPNDTMHSIGESFTFGPPSGKNIWHLVRYTESPLYKILEGIQ